MKNILLIITLFISWNAFAEEKTWFCSSEKSGGLIYENNSWKSSLFKVERMTVKQQDDTLSFSSKRFKEYLGTSIGSIGSCGMLYGKFIKCTGGTKMFILNPNNGLATSSSIYGWLAGEDDSPDSLSVDLWRCESF
jgi:hypothetical protein